MTDYRTIKGLFIKEKTADPVGSDIVEGEIFFNTTENAIKANKLTFGTGAWSTGGNLNTARGYTHGFGSLNSGLICGGSPYNAPPKAQLTELYDGSSWTEVNDQNNSKSAGSSAGGSQTSGIAFGGGPPPSSVNTESWDGTNWTEVNNLNTGTNNGPAGFGTQTAAAETGGDNPPTPNCELWDGTNWTEVNNLNTARRNTGASGSQTAGIIAGGQVNPSTTTNAEEWNGTSWTEVGNLNTTRRGGTMGGIQTDALYVGGPSIANSENYDGSSWTEVGDLSTARADSAASRNSTSAVPAGLFVAGGPQSGTIDATEEFTVPSSVQVNSITVS